MPRDEPVLRIRGAAENNLREIDLDLPHDALVVFTGVSGSGKSSLAFDTIFREGERRYLQTLSLHTQRLVGRLARPRVASIDGVRPAIAIDQSAASSNPRSTVGTLSEIGDELRLLWARFGERKGEGPPIDRSLFSFNTDKGACPVCRGLGQEEHVDPMRIVQDEKKTLREGALVPTLPNGYIVYSQVTPEALDTVCRAHGFDIDTPWAALTDEQREVIFFGSDRVEVPFGKHSLESRLKWSGIKAKPREMGHYRGIARVIGETLAKKRNANILRFVSARPCGACGGSRLSEAARAVTMGGVSIDRMYASTVAELSTALARCLPEDDAARAIAERIALRGDRLATLGLGHLALSRPTATLSGGESRRLRLANQLGTALSGVAYIFDEPSAGAHVEERRRLVALLEDLRDRGNSVFVVEHDREIVRAADHIVRIGPGAGREGGYLECAGPPRAVDLKRTIATKVAREGRGVLRLEGVAKNNLADIDVALRVGALNVVTGCSGAGKTSLVVGALVPHVRASGEGFERVLLVEQGEIGRTPRSNPATYSGAFDLVRACFAATPLARARGFDKGYFSFNKPKGRCERCEGAGVEMVGLMSLPAVALTCGACDGRRFSAEVLEVRYGGRSILEVLESTIEEAAELFVDEPRIVKILAAMIDVGLGYLTLGQPAPTLSGGEGQRLQLAKEMAKSSGSKTLVVLDEPTSGLGASDVERFVDALDHLVDSGATVVAADHDLGFIARADWVVDLGPGSGPSGGRVVASGTPAQIAEADTATGRALAAALSREASTPTNREPRPAPTTTSLVGVSTRNLRGVDVEFETGSLTVVTGVSGSGKSSLVFDTLAAEGQRRFAESFSPYLRRQLRSTSAAVLDVANGLRPTVAIRARSASADPRSTVGTATQIDTPLRLLFARAGDREGLTAGHFSFNDALGACPVCDGRGRVPRCDVERLVVDPNRSIADGVLAETRAGRLLFEIEGRLHATLVAFLEAHGFDPTVPWKDLDDPARALVTRGAQEERTIVWEAARLRGEAAHELVATWGGVEPIVEAEYEKKRDKKQGPLFAELLVERLCEVCRGARLRADIADVRVGDWRLFELRTLEVRALAAQLRQGAAPTRARAILDSLLPRILPVLEELIGLGLGHLTLDRTIRSLSTGERRRVEIATQLVRGLRDVCYVLDEPCLGLHVRDRERLANTLRSIARTGNTVVVVEHDETVIRAADVVVEIGPGAGPDGGRVVAKGSPERIAAGDSATGAYLSRKTTVARTATFESTPGPVVRGANDKHLKGIDLAVRFREILAIAGVSGSGKSTLVFDVLAKSLEANRPIGCRSLEAPANVVRIEPRPVGGGPMSVVATYLDLLGPIADRFAKTSDAKVARRTRASFTFGSKAGRCPECLGSGEERIAMDFLPDAVRPCPTCDGTRYDPSVLACRLDGRSIADVLAMDVGALTRWPKIEERIALLVRFGLGHLTLDRRADSLSGGESQRLSMVRALAQRGATRPTVFLFDEPSRGLHFSDQMMLVRLFEALASAGHAVVFTEHAPSLLMIADRIVELGPGAGEAGGAIVFEGEPSALAGAATPTGEVLHRRV